MSTWLSITVIAGAQVISQLISVVGAILYESLEDGSVLLIIPESAGHERAATGRAISGALREQSLP